MQKQKKWHSFFGTLRFQLIFVVIVLTTVSVMSMQALNLYNKMNHETERARLDARIIAQTLSRFYDAYQIHGSRERFNSAMTALSGRQDVYRIAISTPTHGTVFNYSNFKVRQDSSIESQLFTAISKGEAEAVIHRGKSFGVGQRIKSDNDHQLDTVIVLEVNTLGILLQKMIERIWLGFVVLLVLTAASIRFMIRYLTKGLNEVKNKAAFVAEGKRKIRIDVQGHNEIADLGSNLNAMFEALDEQVETINELAYIDRVTGLPNRTFFQLQLKNTLDLAERHNRCGALLFIDLDGFKNVNDTLGHDAGDMLLEQVAHRIASCIRASDAMTRLTSVEPDLVENPQIARIGGDEFTLLLSELAKPSDAAIVASRILEQFQNKFLLDGGFAHIGASIGIACFPYDGSDENSILKRADLAMYCAKNAGKNRFVFFSEEMDQQAHQLVELSQELRTALQDGEFEVYYQPYFNVFESRPKGLSAVLRWNRPNHGVVEADIFEEGLSQGMLEMEVGAWLLAQVCKFSATLEKLDLALPISVPLGPRQLERRDFVENVAVTLHRYGVQPSALRFEMCESVVRGFNQQTQTAISQLVKMGIGVTLDNFSQGGASLQQLADICVDQIKLHSDLVAKFDETPVAQKVFQASLVTSKTMDIKPIAQGIETPKQLESVKMMGCRFGQGKWLCPAIEEKAVVKALTRKDGELVFTKPTHIAKLAIANTG